MNTHQPLDAVQATSDRHAEELTFLNAPEAGGPLMDVPRLTVGVAGGPLRSVVVDSGYIGVVLSSSAFPGVDRLLTLGPGTLTYSSSGRIMRGRWSMTALILAVEAVACTPTARHAAAVARPRRHAGAQTDR